MQLWYYWWKRLAAILSMADIVIQKKAKTKKPFTGLFVCLFIGIRPHSIY
jgi:hypothetical protein